MKTRTSGKPALFACSVLMVAALACSSSTNTTSTPKVSTATTAPKTRPIPSDAPKKTEITVVTQTPENTATPLPILYLGDTVTSDDGYALTATVVHDPAKPGLLYGVKEGKRLISVEVILANLSGDLLNVNPLYATLLDTAGYTYNAALAATDDEIISFSLAQGEKIKGVIAFEIPEGATVASIRYSTTPLGSQFLQASLLPPPDDHTAIPEPKLTPKSGLPKLGDVLENFGYSLAATAVSDPAKPGMLYQAKPGYKLVAVEITLQNVSANDALNVNPLYAYLLDSDGFIHQNELGALDEEISTTDLNKGQKLKGWVAYSIPVDAKPVSIKYSIQPFSDRFLQVGLMK